MSKEEKPGNLNPRFVVDCMLGQLAKWLRILGFDTLYSNAWEDRELLEAARAEGRIILTRDTGFYRLVSGVQQAIFIENDSFRYQLREVILRLDFIPPAEMFFTRCSRCNHPLTDLPREEARARVPEYVFKTQEHFVFCPKCGRTYWSGTHQVRAREMLGEIFSSPGQDKKAKIPELEKKRSKSSVNE